MKPVNLIAAIIIFGVGVSCGWWLARQQILTGPDSTLTNTPRQASSDRPVQPRAAASVQWLNVSFGGQTRTVPAVVLKGRGIMIASLYQVFPAERIVLDTRAGGPPIFPELIAASSQTQLVALSWEGSGNTGLELSTDSGSLFLGKEVVLRLPNERLPGTIQSALVRDARGVESFRVDLQRSTSSSDGPLIEPGTDSLIGFVIAARALPGQTTTPLRAVDALQITALLDNHRLPEAMNISNFSSYWFDQPDGLRLAAEQAFARENWMDAYHSALRLWSTATDFSAQDQRLLTTAAFQHALQLIDTGEINSALETANAVRPSYPTAQTWCLVDARAQAHLLQWQEALRSLGYCLDNSPQLTAGALQDENSVTSRTVMNATYREWVTQLVHDPAQTMTSKFNALQGALDREPHAPMYRLLADLQYDAQIYAHAHRNYELAIQLDPALATELSARMETSQQRTTTAPLAEIPFEASRGSIIVEGQLNDSTQTFRLLVDTGATYCALSRTTLLRLGLNDVFNRGAPVIELESAAGPIYVQRFQINSVALGPARVDNVPVVLLESLEGVDGLIGLSFLRHFGVELDQQAGKLILTRL